MLRLKNNKLRIPRNKNIDVKQRFYRLTNRFFGYKSLFHYY